MNNKQTQKVRAPVKWTCHQMEAFSALLAICEGKSPVPVNSPHKGQWRGALMFSLIYAGINGWVNTGEVGDLIRHHTHYDVIVMIVVSTPDSFIGITFDLLTN